MTESCRLVTTEQYKEYQLLKEEHKPITWDELKEKAKDIGLEIIVGSVGDYTYEKIVMGKLHFYRDGTITCPFEYVNVDGYPSHDRVIIAETLKPEQMLMIMRWLE